MIIVIRTIPYYKSVKWTYEIDCQARINGRVYYW